jgi:hypothetical protein
MIVPLNSWYHRVSVTNRLIAYTEVVLWTGVSTHNMSRYMTVFVCKVDRAHHPLHLPLFQI